MPLQIVGDTAGNEIEIDREYARGTDGVVVLGGKGIRISIRTSRPARHLRLDMDANSHFAMGRNAFAADLHVHLRGGSRAEIGENTFAIGRLNLFSHETATITIGRNCLIGEGLQCLTSDMHSVLDKETGARINPPGNISIADDVWVGAEAIVLKGTSIGTGSVVGIRSVVAGEFPSNCMMLGYPARLVKSGVTWSEDLKPYR